MYKMPPFHCRKGLEKTKNACFCKIIGQLFCYTEIIEYLWKLKSKTNKKAKILRQELMSYLRFEKAVMTNLEESIRRELLRTNRSGAYSCSTIVDCNTRKYHGLLVVPVPELDYENHVLLSSLDATVVQH